jgi:hypothetical protein
MKTDTSHVTAIDSARKLRAVARLADEYGHRGAHNAIRELALAAGCTVRGGRIYAPRYHPRDTAPTWQGWVKFRWHLKYHGLPESLIGDMVTHALRRNTTIEISPTIAARIREDAKAVA